MKAHFIVLSISLIAVEAKSARAQFRGDVYFAEPSIAVTAGSEATLEIRTFTGATALGAIHFEFEFNPEQLEVLKVEAGTTVEFSTASRYALFSDRISIVTLNGESVARPFGTISLARLTIKPKVDAGKTISVRVRPRDAIDTNGQRLNTRGFGASIAVVSSTAVMAVGAPSKSKPASTGIVMVPQATYVEAQLIGKQIARPGHALKIIMPRRTDEGVWVAVEVPVNTIDANAPSDRDAGAGSSPGSTTP